MARGVNGSAVFFDSDDYDRYLGVLEEASRAQGCSIHAYVLMTNHVHLLMTPQSESAIPRVIQALGRKYVQAINRKYRRTGTLWEGRYRVSLVDRAAYLLACYRYIELNPVRAGLCPTPGLYPYSSYRCNADGRFDSIVVPHEGYLALGANPELRRSNYRRLFEEAMSPAQLRAIREAANACRVLGDGRFKRQVEACIGRSVEPRKVGRPRRKCT